MLTYFSVEGYRNFNHRIEWDFLNTRDYRFNGDALMPGVRAESSVVKCALVYGRNAVGKTNLGNAIFDVWANLGMRNSVLDLHNYLNADGENEDASFEYHFMFSGRDVRYVYKKTSSNNLIYERLELDGRVVFEFDNNANELLQNSLDLIGASSLNWEFKERNLSILGYICNNTPLDVLGPIGEMYRFISNMGMIEESRISDRRFVSYIVERIIEREKVGELESFLRRFGIDEHLVVSPSPSGDLVLYFDHKRPIPFSRNCSSGTVALLRLFNYFLLRPESSLLFVDEFDAFYHHDLAEEVLRFFKEDKRHQVICASHNTDLFSNKIMRPDCLFILSRNGIISAADATKRELREGHNLEKLYKAGEFDA